jgi:hypothetical protein
MAVAEARGGVSSLTCASFTEYLLICIPSSTEAEPEVLADYVIALLSTEGPIETVKQAAVDALSEFLPDRACCLAAATCLGLLVDHEQEPAHLSMK